MHLMLSVLQANIGHNLYCLSLKCVEYFIIFFYIGKHCSVVKTGQYRVYFSFRLYTQNTGKSSLIKFNDKNVQIVRCLIYHPYISHNGICAKITQCAVIQICCWIIGGYRNKSAFKFIILLISFIDSIQ